MNSFVRPLIRRNPGQISPALREHIKDIDPDLATADVSSMTERVSYSLWRQRLSSRVLGAFSSAALGIALLGVFGVTSYVLTRRSREIGIRMAMGASPEDIWKMVLAQNFVQVIIGLGVGVAGSIVLTPVARPPVRFAARRSAHVCCRRRGSGPCGIGGFVRSSPQGRKNRPAIVAADRVTGIWPRWGERMTNTSSPDAFCQFIHHRGRSKPSSCRYAICTV
jgi:hypothetical protein